MSCSEIVPRVFFSPVKEMALGRNERVSSSAAEEDHGVTGEAGKGTSGAGLERMNAREERRQGGEEMKAGKGAEDTEGLVDVGR